MRLFTIGSIAAAALAGTLSLAQAMPAGAPGLADDASVTLVAGGCGPGFFRGPYGGCRAMRGFGPRFVRPYGRPFYGRPGFGPRPYGYGYGPRRFY